MYFMSFLLVLLHSGFSLAAPRIPLGRSARGTVTTLSVASTSFSGSGCPEGATDISTDRWENFSFRLPGFKAKTGPSSAVAERSVNCQAHSNFGVSTTGWQFALKEHWSKGYLETDGAGVTLTQYLTVYFSHDAANAATTVQYIRSNDNLTISKNLSLHTTISEATLIWSPCDGSSILNVNFHIAFTGATRNVTAYYGANNNVLVSEQ
ncbi:hypothetical protein F4859DRAFT_501262 [Xylaria cf. heliscus]|nr:hypothetical protein F4859DRAFT_501262 [Xylaria cf. heliscus]